MLRKVVRDARLRARVLERVEEFRLNKRASERVWFRELVLCILTANSSFIGAFTALQYLGDLILYGSIEEISSALKNAGYRFPNLKARYIVESRSYYGKLREIGRVADRDQIEAREMLLEIKGLGMKEASHFLRNMGYLDLAIIDRHILRFFSDYLEDQKISSKSKYLELESVFRSIASALDLPVGVLDLYVWYLKTGKLAK
ncbi:MULTISPECIES: N-glycosylase/DNA lyase [Metallosphaera]|uniref:N-glycosylase/DNA lyase n=1 Tax=Metallosphaera TaxID=41980 RepID=UPI001F0630A8|nr:N-glycosylase/DNA lyase [Metallosphaera sedula]MCH1771290.1 N-glycosylase/DNA lyase [Metallosphaera sedula]MCP6729680.1 N-glycosylase/DNA lyase [Metallosphaera sedula]